jgi:hypothetical protein
LSAEFVEAESSTPTWTENPEAQSLPVAQIPVLPPVSPTSSTAELFGNFEREEQVSVGNVTASPPAAARATPPQTLESILHQEIVGICEIAESRDASADQQAENSDSESGEYVEEPEQERVEEFVSAVEEEKPDVANDEDANPAILKAVQKQQIRIHADRVRDDSDILVIEDEIDVRRVDNAARVDAQDQTISVDFQVMLNQMRNGG